MPIVTVCQGCGQRLSVSEEHAGHTARCPKCKRVYTVPAATAGADLRPVTSGDSHQDGNVYGPVTKAELDQWVAEGRVTATSQLLHDPDQHWQPAGQTYPQLRSMAAGNPFADPATPSNPYATPTGFAPTMGPRRFRRPHRGGTILTLGILGVICCQLLGARGLVHGPGRYATDQRRGHGPGREGP